MDLVIKQSISQQESVTAELVDKLYQLTKPDTITGQPAANAVLVGRLEAPAAYEDAVTFLNAQFSSAQDNGSDLRVSVLNNNYYIRFADSAVEEILKFNMGKDEGEGITLAEAAATSIGTMFKNNKGIENFEELKYFSYTGGDFEGCSNLHTVDVGNKNISPLSFHNCVNLEKINGSAAEPGVIRIPEGTTSISGYLFAGCPKISVVYLPDTLTSLGYKCFNTTSRIPGTYLTEIHFGLGISRIDPNVFQTPLNLTEVYIKDLERWLVCDIQGSISSSHHLYIENDGNPVEITSLDLTGKTTINGYVFHGCRYITSVVLGNTLASIGNSAFQACSNLVIADLNLPNLTALGTYAFSSTKVQAISDLGSVSTIPEYCFKNCSQLTTIDQGVLDKITVLNREAFNLCTNLGSAKQSDNTISSVLRLPNLTSIELDAVRYTKFTEIADLGSITAVKGFSEMYSLTNVVLPQTCTTIGQAAFVNDAALTTIDISNITSIGAYAFNGCNNLTYFHGVGSTAGELNLSNVTSIGDKAFNECKGMTSVFIGSSLISTGVAAFSGCVNLTAVNITDLDAWWGIAFGNNSNSGNYCANPLYYAHHLYLNGVEVKDVVVPNNVTSIGKAVFAGGSLTSITIHNSVTSIGRSAFENCRDLPTVTIPNSMTLIQAFAFSDCTGLTSVIINAITPPTLEGANAFHNTNNCPIYVPTGSVEAYKSASGWSSLASRIQAIPT